MTIVEPTDLENLAALVDGTLSPAARRALEERLDHDEEFREVLAELIRWRAEEDVAGAASSGDQLRPVGVAPLPEGAPQPAPPTADTTPATPGLRSRGRMTGRRSWAWLAAAAIVVMAAGGAWVYRLRGQTGPVDERWVAVVATGSPQLTAGWFDHDWPVARGRAPDTPAATETAQALAPRNWTALRLGVTLTDLEVALGAGRLEEFAVLTHRAELLLGQAGTSPAMRLAVVEARDHAASEPIRAQASLRLMAELLVAESVVPAQLLIAGAWLETARLASLTGNVGLLTERRFRSSFPGEALEVLGPAGVDASDRLGQLLDELVVRPSELPRVAAEIERLFGGE